jgi:polyphosphate kinase
VRLTEPTHLEEIDSIFERDLDDSTASWWLDASGLWTHHARDADGNPLEDSQSALQREISSRRRLGILR